jgi:hypothetical protein
MWIAQLWAKSIEPFFVNGPSLIQRFKVSVDEREARSRFFNAKMSTSENVAEYAQRIVLDAENSVSFDKL